MDLITYDRIKFLHPKIRNEVREIYDEINRSLLPPFVRLRFAYTLRTINEQNQLYAQGRTKLFDKTGKRLGIVTNAKGGQSIHNYGLAFDIVILHDKDKNGTFETASWKVDSDWMKAIKAFKSHGYFWGGDWGWKDNPHLEKNFKMTWREMKLKLNSGDTFEETIDGKKYKWINI